MGRSETIFDGMTWYYDGDEDVSKINKIYESSEYKQSIVTINDHNIELFNSYQDQIERLNSQIDSLISLLESQNRVLEILLKDKKHG
jgi:TolA-binding protein